jgi:hypothetical protein
MITPTSYGGHPVTLAPPAWPLPLLRNVAVQALQAASAGLARTAARLATARAVAPDASAQQCIEFHADAGALEGALYVDGRLVAHVPGVRRL